jgi:hypothetical protein
MYKRGDKGGQEDVSNTTAVEAMCIGELYVRMQYVPTAARPNA